MKKISFWAVLLSLGGLMGCKQNPGATSDAGSATANPDTARSAADYDRDHADTVKGAADKTLDGANKVLNNVDKGIHKSGTEAKDAANRGMDKVEDKVH
jgi:hypothetical protein